MFSVVTGQCCWDRILWAWPDWLSCHGNGVSWSPSFCCNGRQNHAVGCAWSLDTRRCSNIACGIWNCESKSKIWCEVLTSQSIVSRLSVWQPKNLGSIPTAGKRLFMEWLPLKVTETKFFTISEWVTNDTLLNPKRLWNIFSSDWTALFVKPAIHLHLLVNLKVHGALPTLCHTSFWVILNLSQKQLDFLFPK